MNCVELSAFWYTIKIHCALTECDLFSSYSGVNSGCIMQRITRFLYESSNILILLDGDTFSFSVLNFVIMFIYVAFRVEMS